MTNASFCLFICSFVFASNSGHFRINNFFAIFHSVTFVKLFFVKFIFVLAKKWEGGGGL